ncbi:MAG: zinc ribbon domain-containing protein [Anaerolineae bacterium]
MPLYEYRCEECGTRFELRRTMSASADPAICPECASDHAERQVSLFISMVKGGTSSPSASGGCGCGGACACGGHSMN